MTAFLTAESLLNPPVDTVLVEYLRVSVGRGIGGEDT